MRKIPVYDEELFPTGEWRWRPLWTLLPLRLSRKLLALGCETYEYMGSVVHDDWLIYYWKPRLLRYRVETPIATYWILLSPKTREALPC